LNKHARENCWRMCILGFHPKGEEKKKNQLRRRKEGGGTKYHIRPIKELKGGKKGDFPRPRWTGENHLEKRNGDPKRFVLGGGKEPARKKGGKKER